MTLIRSARYHQYDTYFFFDDPSQGRLRYREDEFLDERGNVTNFRARLTLTGEAREAQFGSVLLFRSRYLAPATHSRRFYREYFKPAREHDVDKERRRWLLAYRGVEFNVHLDRLIWEAPLRNQQEYLILRFGPDVGLGNIQPREVLATEALRAGLRFTMSRSIPPPSTILWGTLNAYAKGWSGTTGCRT